MILHEEEGTLMTDIFVHSPSVDILNTRTANNAALTKSLDLADIHELTGINCFLRSLA